LILCNIRGWSIIKRGRKVIITAEIFYFLRDVNEYEEYSNK
tara:strand:+ start:121 stop:243 length:123 start_codon:yes stop_codon:yes gene_type:complete